MNLLSTILDRLNQRIEVGNIFDQIYGLSELSADGNDKAWIHYIGNGQAIPVTNFDAKQGTLFWSKRGKISVAKIETFKLAGCKSLYETKFSLSANAVVRKSHLPCDSADAQDWIASRVLRLISGTDPDFKVSIGVVSYEVVPSGYTNEIKSLPANYEWASVTIDVDINVVSGSEDGCYDTCQSGDIPLPDFEPCTPCLTEVAVDGVTITGNGTEADPLVAIGGGGGTPLRTQDEGVNVSTNTTTLNFTGAGVTASLTSPGVVQVNVPGGGGGGGVTAVTGTAPIASSGGATPDISISQADGSTDGYLSQADWTTFDGKQDVLSAGTGISITGTTIDNTAPDQVVSLTPGTGISVSGTYPNFTIDNTAPSSGGTVTSVNAGVNISVTGTATDPIINSLADRYKTTSATSNSVSNGSKTFTVDLNLAYIPLQEILIVHDPANHMHGEVTSYNPATGVLVVDVKNNTGSGTYTSWDINLDGQPIDAISGTGTPNEIAYFTGGQVIGSLATATYPSLTELSYAKGVTSAIQTQLNGKFATPTGTTSQYVRGDGSLATFPTIPSGTVTSVGLTMPAAFSVANSPVTSSGTLAVTGAGTTAEYIRGDGTLATFPSVPTIFKSTTDGTGISVAAETISASQLIPANTFAVGDIIRVTWRVTKTGTASQITCKLYVNTSASLVGALQQGVIQPGFTNSNSNGFQRHLAIKTSTNTQSINSTSNIFTDYNTLTAFGTANIDWTVNQYIIFMCQLQFPSADVVRTSFYLIEKL